MFSLCVAKVYQEHVCLSWKFNWRYFLIRATYRRNFRLIERLRVETQNAQNDSFSNFVLKFLFSRWIDFAKFFFKKTQFLWSIGNLKNTGGIPLSAPNKIKKPKISVFLYGTVQCSDYMNRSIAKKFLIETLFKMVDSNTKNLEDLEYDK